MSDKKAPAPVVKADARGEWQTLSHPLEPASQLSAVSLSEPAGMSRVGVHLFRLAPGKVSFPYHSHRVEEEWMFVLSGRSEIEIGDEKHALAAGDFVGFATPSAAHRLANRGAPGDEDLVYLAGGERTGAEVADFPRLGKRLVRVGQSVDIYPIAAGEGFPGWPRL